MAGGGSWEALGWGEGQAARHEETRYPFQGPTATQIPCRNMALSPFRLKLNSDVNFSFLHTNVHQDKPAAS